MSAARWPEAVAAGISLLEVALGPEIVEEAFAISWAWTPLGRLAAGPMPKRGAATILSSSGCGVFSTTSVLSSCLDCDGDRPPDARGYCRSNKQAVRESGAGALAEPSNKLKLQGCDHSALAELDRWLLGQSIAT